MNIKEAMRSIDKEISFDYPIVAEYEEILSNKKHRFENGTWYQPNAHNYAQIILRYLFEEKLNFTFEDIKTLHSYSFKTKWKLNGLIKYVYQGSFQEAILDIYDMWVNPWDFKQSTRYLTDEERIESWLMEFAEEHLNFTTKEELLSFFSTSHLRKNHSKVFIHFKSSPYMVYRYFYPEGEIKPYEFNMSYNNIWDDKEVVDDYLKSLLKEEGITTKDDYIGIVSSKNFRSKMRGLYKTFNNSPWKLYLYLKEQKIINFEMKIFELKVVPNGFYQSDKNKIEALHWLIYEKLKITSKSEYIERISTKTIDKYIRGLGTFLKSNEELFSFVDENKIIPWHIYPWEYKTRTKDLWEREEIHERAIVWFFEEYLKLKREEVSVDTFKVKDIWDARLKELYQPYFSQIYPNPKELWVETYLNKSENI